MGLGLAALLVGVMALPLAWVPGVGPLGMAVAGGGVLLGVVGVIMAGLHRGEGLAFPIAGWAVSCVALGVGLAQHFGVFTPHVEPTNPPVVAVVEPSKPPPEPAKPAEEPAAPAKELPWFDISRNPYQVDDVRLRLGHVIVGRVQQVLIERSETPDDCLGVQLRIENIGKTRKIDYRGWATSAASSIRLHDNFGNPYRRREPDLLSTFVGQVREPTAIHPGEHVDDLLVFEKPIPKISYLRLELPAAALGGTGTFRLHIPGSVIRR
jgi:hypothetical protein